MAGVLVAHFWAIIAAIGAAAAFAFLVGMRGH